jgi:hypothetical protein
LIGSQGSAIMLRAQGVAPQHARIVITNGQYIIQNIAGSVCVNGQLINQPTLLHSGDVITIATITLTFQGGNLPTPIAYQQPTPVVLQPPTTPLVPPAIPTTTFQPPPPKVTPAPPPPTGQLIWPAPAQPPAVATKAVLAGPPPQLEGRVIHVDGPHQEDPDFTMGIFFVKLMLLPLLIWRPALGLLLGNRGSKQVPVRYLRVRDQSGQEHNIKMKGDIVRGAANQGDYLSFWGQWQNGTLVMQRGYNHQIQADIHLQQLSGCAI